MKVSEQKTTFTARVIQFLLPDGRERENTVELPIAVEQAYKTMTADGCRFEAEVLPGGQVSVSIANPSMEEDIDIMVTGNGPAVQDGMVNMLERYQFTAREPGEVELEEQAQITLDEFIDHKKQELEAFKAYYPIGWPRPERMLTSDWEEHFTATTADDLLPFWPEGSEKPRYLLIGDDLYPTGQNEVSDQNLQQADDGSLIIVDMQERLISGNGASEWLAPEVKS